jgi:uncharacterized protein YecT (DUF1311 family)
MITVMRVAALLLAVAACAQTAPQTPLQADPPPQADEQAPVDQPVQPATPIADCSRAATVVEKQICANPELASLDSRIATLLAQALTVVSARDAEALRGDQRAWLRDRDECGNRAHGGSSNHADVDACLRRELNMREGLLRVVVASKQFTKP